VGGGGGKGPPVPWPGTHVMGAAMVTAVGIATTTTLCALSTTCVSPVARFTPRACKNICPQTPIVSRGDDAEGHR
jgi:hypothetical protein